MLAGLLVTGLVWKNWYRKDDDPTPAARIPEGVSQGAGASEGEAVGESSVEGEVLEGEQV